MLVAKHFIDYNGRKYTPGEVIEQNIDPTTLEWYEHAGAVEEIPEEKTESEKPARKAKKPSTVEAEEAPEEMPEVPVEMDPTESISAKRRKR